MVGLNKPFDYSARDDDEEEGQSLLLSSNSGSGGGRSRRGLGANGGGGGVWPRIYKFGALIVGSLVLVAVYQYGRGRGYALEEGAGMGAHSDVDESDLYEKKPEVSTADAVPDTAKKADADDAPTDPPFPTYKPTPPATPTIPAPAADAPTDPPFPTYKPTPPATPTTPSEPAATPEEDTAESEAESEAESGVWVPEPNPYVDKFNTTEWNDFHKKQWEPRANNAILINEKYGTYCPKDPAEPMCPQLNEEGGIVDAENPEKLAEGPSVKCVEAGKKGRCGPGPGPWLNKTIWPLIRGPFCAGQDEERQKSFPMPDELRPYFDLGYDRADPTKSVDAEPFDGGTPDPKKEIKVPFDFAKARDHFVKFEAMLEHYYEGLARSLLERQLSPKPESKLYAPMVKAYADQISRAIVRAANAKEEEGDLKKMVVGVLGDSVTSGTDNCYYDAWPEVFRRQMSPLFAAMGVELEVRNAGKNGGHKLGPQMLCAHDMLGAADRPDDLGLDFLFQCNHFVKAAALDAEHLIRRALLGKSHTVVSMYYSNGIDVNAMLERYAAAGLTVASVWGASPPELGIPAKGYKFWFPAQDRSFWGMQGDGFCHLTTRGGSAPIVNRNWHWGPKLHQTYADAYGLLFSRAARLAIDELSAGRMAPEPPKPKDFETVLAEETHGIKEDKPPTWHQLLYSDMKLDEAAGAGLGGVRCAVGLANQAGSTLLPHWLRPVEGSPFEEKMKARNGVSFVPVDHNADGSKFYKITSPISNANNAVEVGGWVANPKTFGAEAPRTAEQCRHVDGSTLVNAPKPDGVSWLVWEVPEGVVSIGRAMMCQTGVPSAESFDNGDIRSHYAVPDGKGGWKVVEDAHKSKPTAFVGQLCTPFLHITDDSDLKAASGGMWVAIERKAEAATGFIYLVAM